MVDVVNKKCKNLDCEILNPNFNVKGQTKGEFCGSHKTNDMVDVIHNKCISCGLFQVSKKGVLCSYCDPVSTIRQKTKELQIKTLLETHNIKFIHDKGISNDCCLKYRPDFVIDCIDYFIVLEVGEFAHKGYEQDCEIVRMNNISHSLGLPTKFLRYNPDLKGISKKIKEEMLMKRLGVLMNYFDNNFTAEYLFYPEK